MQTTLKTQMSDNAQVSLVDNLDDLLQKSDIVSLHLDASDEENEGIVDEYFLEQMGPKSLLMNFAGANLIDNDDNLMLKLQH